MQVISPSGLGLPIKPGYGNGIVARGMIRSGFAVIEGHVGTAENTAVQVFSSASAIGSFDSQPEVQPADPATKTRPFRVNIPLGGNVNTGTLSQLTTYVVIDGQAQQLPTAPTGYFLDTGTIDARGIYLKITHQGTRIADRETLLYYALRALEHNIADPVAAGSCLCTIGYRELEVGEHSDHSIALGKGDEVIGAFGELNNRQHYRWYVSCNLMMAYFHIIRREYARASSRLSHIIAASSNLAHTPQMLTNTLKACLLLGFVDKKLLHEQANAGANAWSKARSYFTLASAKWEFENHYSFIELNMCTALLEQCHAAECLEAVASGRKKDDRMMTPVGLRVDFTPLGFPADKYGFRLFLDAPGVSIYR